MIPLKRMTKTSNDHSEDLRVLLNLRPDPIACTSYLLRLDRNVSDVLVTKLDSPEIAELYRRLVSGWNKNPIL